MPRLTKRQKANAELVPTEPQSTQDAVKIVKSFKAPKFDQTINVVVHLGIDPKQADQALRGSISMPKGIGKSARVVAFCNEDVAAQAREAGAIEAGSDELVAKVEGGWTEFDVAIASPDQMRVLLSVANLGHSRGKSRLFSYWKMDQ